MNAINAYDTLLVVCYLKVVNLNFKKNT